MLTIDNILHKTKENEKIINRKQKKKLRFFFRKKIEKHKRGDQCTFLKREEENTKMIVSEVGFEPTPGEPDCDLNAAP